MLVIGGIGVYDLVSGVNNCYILVIWLLSMLVVILVVFGFRVIE